MGKFQKKTKHAKGSRTTSRLTETNRRSIGSVNGGLNSIVHPLGSSYTHGIRNVHNLVVVFDSIVTCIVGLINSVPYIKTACCWVTSREILRAMRSRGGVSLLVSRGSFARRMLHEYTTLPRFPTEAESNSTAIKMIGSDSRFGSLMHNKFTVGYDVQMRPLWVVVGSYNYTPKGSKNLENIVLIKDRRVAEVFANEFNNMWLHAHDP